LGEVEDIEGRRTIMPEQFENPKAVKLEDETVSDASSQTRVDREAEKLARMSATTEKKFDNENSKLFSK
jgi:hypothetical protein